MRNKDRRYKVVGDMASKAMMVARYTAQLEHAELYNLPIDVLTGYLDRDMANLADDYAVYRSLLADEASHGS